MLHLPFFFTEPPDSHASCEGKGRQLLMVQPSGLIKGAATLSSVGQRAPRGRHMIAQGANPVYKIAPNGIESCKDDINPCHLIMSSLQDSMELYISLFHRVRTLCCTLSPRWGFRTNQGMSLRRMRVPSPCPLIHPIKKIGNKKMIHDDRRGQESRKIFILAV